jgi:hypothetical protein
MKRWQRLALVGAAAIVPALSCGQRSLVLIDVKASGTFPNPNLLLNAGLQVTANRQVTTHFSQVHLQTGVAYQIGMYLPSDMNGTVTFVADVDNGDCVFGTGMATATGVQSGETTQAIQLVVMPTVDCTPIHDGGAGSTGTGGVGGSSGTTGAGGVDGMSGVAGVTGSAGSGPAGRGGTTGTAGVTGTGGIGTAGIGGAGGMTAGTAGRGGTSGAGGITGTGGVTTGIAGRGGTTGTAGIGGMQGTAGIGGAAGIAGRGGMTGTAGIGGAGGTAGRGGVGGGTVGVGGLGGGGPGVGGVGGGGPGVGGSGVGGVGVGGAGGGPNCGSIACVPPYVCNGSGACVCSESDAQACARAGIACGYVFNNCNQQVFCACKLVGQMCDTVNNLCTSGCVTGTGGIITADIICPPPPI